MLSRILNLQFFSDLTVYLNKKYTLKTPKKQQENSFEKKSYIRKNMLHENDTHFPL